MMKKPTEKEIANYMKSLDLTYEEAIQMWREDEGIEANAEQAELDATAKKVKINHGAQGFDKTKKRERQPRTSLVSNEKKELFEKLNAFLVGEFGENAKIVNENKEFSIKIDEKVFKIDLVERRKPKK